MIDSEYKRLDNSRSRIMITRGNSHFSRFPPYFISGGQSPHSSSVVRLFEYHMRKEDNIQSSANIPG